jgi:hypothetical protein
MVATIVGAKTARPWTVILLRRKINAVASVTGLAIPSQIFFVSMRSRTSVVET